MQQKVEGEFYWRGQRVKQSKDKINTHFVTDQNKVETINTRSCCSRFVHHSRTSDLRSVQAAKQQRAQPAAFRGTWCEETLLAERRERKLQLCDLLSVGKQGSPSKRQTLPVPNDIRHDPKQSRVRHSPQRNKAPAGQRRNRPRHKSPNRSEEDSHPTAD